MIGSFCLKKRQEMAKDPLWIPASRTQDPAGALAFRERNRTSLDCHDYFLGIVVAKDAYEERIRISPSPLVISQVSAVYIGVLGQTDSLQTSKLQPSKQILMKIRSCGILGLQTTLLKLALNQSYGF